MDKPPTHSEELILKEEAKKYPPPHDNKIFAARWNDHIDLVVGKKNFHVSQLAMLEQLCEMYKQAFYLQAFLDANGIMYENAGRNGFQYKPYPHVTTLASVRANIRVFTKALGLLPEDDDESKPPGTGSGSMSKEDWES